LERVGEFGNGRGPPKGGTERQSDGIAYLMADSSLRARSPGRELSAGSSQLVGNTVASMTQLNIFRDDPDNTTGRDESETGPASQADGSQERWGGLPVSEISGSIEEIRAHLPRFERRSFIIPPSNSLTGVEANSFYDAIVRLPLENTAAEVSVGIVRKSYQLVQHVDLFNLVIDAFQKAKVDTDKVQAKLKATANAERIRLTLLLPETDKFQFRISDNDHMNLRLELFNSVDASTRCVALLGWFRFVCGNGLVVGVTQTEVRGVHNSRLDVNAIGIALSKGLTDAIKEKRLCARIRENRQLAET
jgi:hypothetical protein